MHDLDDSLLAHLPPFSLLSGEDIRDILNQSRTRLVPRGASVFREGDNATTFYLLLDGYVRVERLTQDGDRVIPLHIPPGQLFGIAAALGKETYPATAVAASDCVALEWPMRLWTKFADTYPGFATETYKIVGARLEEVSRRVMELATQRVEQRVACALLTIANQSGKQTASGLQIEFPLTRREISEMTGSTLHTVSRLLSVWQTDGVLVSQNKRICVLDIARLKKLAHAANVA
ncbi:Fumarate and nitrate reduction regulatory protein [Shimia thalassica]|uniref:Fumarate and nitrate reduction regulatory protein n=1 Tax=Shimia thalassica TaxID=1715693 RepID=A0A0P1I9I4_9RHOB|nr:Crp/Fnr family transcriptional regulator [Shimia thalassica]CUJ99547.1 Fumarate and nitrate reduction regulatory protein [Shimia thalassica]